MDVTHHLLAGFKAIVSDEQYSGLDKCRRACGGAGYASMSGFTEIMARESPVPTYEGDNIVMLGQASRYVFKLINKAQKVGKLPFPFEYIPQIPELLKVKGKGQNLKEMFDLEMLRQALAVRAAKLIADTTITMKGNQEPKVVQDNEIFA